MKTAKDGSRGRLSRRGLLKLGAAGALGASGILDSASTRAAAQRSRGATRPNIVYIFSDEHRWCSLSFTEMPELQTPHFERLAGQGTSFDHCISNSPVCVPYRGMLITGMWPHQSTVVSNEYFIHPERLGHEVPTIAQTFKAAGYRTGYIGKWHLKNGTTAEAGFDYFQHWLWGDNHWQTKVRDGNEQGDWDVYTDYNAVGMTDSALQFMRRHAGDNAPFLLMVSWNPPHWRWDDAPEEFVELYEGDVLSRRPNVGRGPAGYVVDNHYRHYHAHISAIDRQMGRVLEELDRLGIAEDTVLIYSSDHGSGFGSNGYHSKPHPYDEAVRVPLIARWPGRIPAGRRTKRLLGSIDIYPTLCGLAGIRPPDHCGGQDLSHLLRGRDGPAPEAQLIMNSNSSRSYFGRRLDPDGHNPQYPFRGVRTERYTFAVYPHGDWVLFDNQADPYQMNNLLDDPAHSELKERLRATLEDLLARSEYPFIPGEWQALPLAQMIHAQDEYYTLVKRQGRLENYRREALEPYLQTARNREQEQKLRTAAQEAYDYPFFGRFLALTRELDNQRLKDERRAQLARELQQHEEAHRRMLAGRAREILGS